MERQHVTRRIVLSAAVVGLAVLTALGGGEGVNAEADRAPDQTPGQLKEDCNAHEGTTYVESKKDDVSACFYPDKSKTVCKFNGKDCYNYPPPKREETGGGPFVGSTGEIFTEIPPMMEAAPTVEETLIGGGVVLADIHVIADDTQTVAPGNQPLFAEAGTAVTAPAQSQGAAPAEPSAPAAPAEAVEAPAEAVETPAEEPMAAAPAEVVETPAEESVAVEASTEQP